MPGLPPPPTNDPTGSFAWLEWFRKLRAYVSTTGSVPWSIINFAGSTLSSIASRSHQVLQALQGGTTGEYYHLTSGEYAGTSQSNIDASKLLGNTWASPKAIGTGTAAAGTFTDLTSTGNTVLGNTVGNTTKVSGTLIVAKDSGYGIKVDTTTPTFGWQDLFGTLRHDTGGVNSPTLAAFRGGVVREFFYSVNDKMDMEFHIPHDYAPGTDLYWHLHWAHNGTAISGNLVVNFASTYAKGHGQAIFPAEKTVTLTVATTDIATTPQYSHRIDEIVMSSTGGSATLWDNALFEPDGVFAMNMTVTGIPTITGGTTNEPCIFYADIHYQSTNIATKNKAPNFYT